MDVATLQRPVSRGSSRGATAARSAAPRGLGAALQPPRHHHAAPAPRLARKRSVAVHVPAALPLFDVSVAVLSSLDDMRAAVEGDQVLASTLHVPAHHLLNCKAEAYGSPFSAPALQALQGAASLSEDDKQFAACLAAPPEMDEERPHGSLTLRHRMVRLASVIRMQQAPSLTATASGALERSAASFGGAAKQAQLIIERDGSVRGRAGAVSRTRSGACDGDDAGRSGSCAVAFDGEHDEAVAAASTSRPGHLPATREDAPMVFGAARQHLLAYAHDAAAALVGVGALLVGGFGARAAPADEAQLMARRVQSLLNLEDLAGAAAVERRRSAIFSRVGGGGAQ